MTLLAEAGHDAHETAAGFWEEYFGVLTDSAHLVAELSFEGFFFLVSVLWVRWQLRRRDRVHHHEEAHDEKGEVDALMVLIPVIIIVILGAVAWVSWTEYERTDDYPQYEERRFEGGRLCLYDTYDDKIVEGTCTAPTTTIQELR